VSVLLQIEIPATVLPVAAHESKVRAGQHRNEQGEKSLARTRYQKGQLLIESGSWVGRWREDVIEDGRVRRLRRSKVLGSCKKLTEKLAKRELDKELTTINDPLYRARPTATFEQFAIWWAETVAGQHKPSTAINMKSHVDRYLIPFFGPRQMRDIRPMSVQDFVASLSKLSPKTVKNILVTFRLAWKSARASGYISHDAFDGVVLPKPRRARSFFFSIEEALRILAAAEEPQRTFYWLAAETGLRAGELCGLRVEDLDLERNLVHVRQSAWRGKLQDPKTENAIRSFALSAQLSLRLKEYLLTWRPNRDQLLFASSAGTPWDANLLVKRKLRPLLKSLGIGGAAFMLSGT
jgi:integrase